jgi:hypothetical protein
VVILPNKEIKEKVLLGDIAERSPPVSFAGGVESRSDSG